jgi:glycosyltransferase involved in cell wall biosynthesis
MVVKNEERVLPRCLDSIGRLADEIVVVDTGSSDDTPKVAARYGAKVTGFDFTRVDFSAARNHALNRATGRWILTLDADEVLHPSSIPLIRELSARDDNAGYYFERLNHGVIPKPTRDYVVRLFPNRRGYRYRGRVHETVDASLLAGGGRLVPTAARIDHEFVSTPESRRQRNHWYIGILKEEIAADPSDSSRLDFLAAEYHQLGMFAEAAEITERVTRARPLDPEAHVRAGLYHLLFQPDRQRARADFLEALRLRPGHARALSFLQLAEGSSREPKPVA